MTLDDRIDQAVAFGIAGDRIFFDRHCGVIMQMVNSKAREHGWSHKPMTIYDISDAMNMIYTISQFPELDHEPTYE